MKTLALLAIFAALAAVALGATVTMSTAMAVSDNFDDTGNPHDSPGAGDGNPHLDHKTGNPHRCPGANCD